MRTRYPPDAVEVTQGMFKHYQACLRCGQTGKFVGFMAQVEDCGCFQSHCFTHEGWGCRVCHGFMWLVDVNVSEEIWRAQLDWGERIVKSRYLMAQGFDGDYINDWRQLISENYMLKNPERFEEDILYIFTLRGVEERQERML